MKIAYIVLGVIGLGVLVTLLPDLVRYIKLKSM
jgi:hypothetical protein